MIYEGQFAHIKTFVHRIYLTPALELTIGWGLSDVDCKIEVGTDIVRVTVVIASQLVSLLSCKCLGRLGQLLGSITRFNYKFLTFQVTRFMCAALISSQQV